MRLEKQQLLETEVREQDCLVGVLLPNRTRPCGKVPMNIHYLAQFPLTLFSAAYYNAGSAALVLLLIAFVVAGFLWWRARRQRLRGLPVSTAEENIPLNAQMEGDRNGNGIGHGAASEEDLFRGRKGKGREPLESEEIFSVGDSDDEDGRTPRTGT